MLTGSRAAPELLPTLSEHPVNLFTLLAPSHDIYALEPVARLCPPGSNLLTERRPGFRQRFALLISDLSIVWLSRTLPGGWRARLPTVERTWSGFGRDHPAARREPRANEPARRALFNVMNSDRAADFRRLVASIGSSSDRPSLHFAHSLLPHTPWEYLPSGRTYHSNRGRIEGLERQGWTPDPWPVLHARKRYLLQVEFVDRLIGELTSRLKSVGLFDESLIAIAADHGISYRPGESHRSPVPPSSSPDQLLDVATVPLVIKAPFQNKAHVEETPTSLVDLAPRLLELAGAEPDKADKGRRPHPPVMVTKYVGNLEIPVDRRSWRLKEALEQANLLGGFSDVGTIGVRPDLHGLKTAGMTILPGDIEIRLERADLWDNVDLDHAELPARVAGVLTGPKSLPDRTAAITVNGVVAATVRPWRDIDGAPRLAALLPERLLRPGFNQIKVFLTANDASRRLEWVERPAGFVYELTRSEQGPDRALLKRPRSGLHANVVSIPILRRDDAQIVGFLEDGHRADAPLSGWATDLSESGSTGLEIVAFLEGRRLLRTGFRAAVPDAPEPAAFTGRHRVFALMLAGTAVELPVLEAAIASSQEPAS